MELELPSQRNCLEHHTPQITGILKQGKITLGLGLTAALYPKLCAKITRQQMLRLPRLKIKNIV